LSGLTRSHADQRGPLMSAASDLRQRPQLSRTAVSRVVHVTAHYPPFLGGLEKVVESLAVSRKMQGLEVDVLTSLDGQPRASASDTAGFVRRLRSWEVAHTSIIPGLPAKLLKLPRHSVIHLHIAHAFVPEMVYLAHLLRGLPYVAHFHLDVGPSGSAGFLLRAYKPLILGPVLRGASTVVVFTGEQRAAIISKYGVDPARVAVIPNGVGETFYYSGRRFPHSKPRLLFVGRLSVQKNLLQLLHALEGVSEQFETTLVGDGELEAQLKETASDLQLQNVRFHGRADGAELHELYRNADVFVLPSDREGMPLVLLEALAMGLPIVATDVSGNRDVVAHNQNGILVPLGDSSALRQALIDVAGDPDRYQRMSQTSRRLAEKYTWDTVSAEFERLYAQAIAN
jgi:glycosyltransferase involved in cell wall biosynthesis